MNLLSYLSRGQKSEMSFSGWKSGCWHSLWSFQSAPPKFVSLWFLEAKDHLHTLAVTCKASSFVSSNLPVTLILCFCYHISSDSGPPASLLFTHLKSLNLIASTQSPFLYLKKNEELQGFLFLWFNQEKRGMLKNTNPTSSGD